MEIAEVVAFFTQFGTPGLMIAYFVWEKREERKERREKFDKDHELIRERIDADLELSRSFTLLTETIRGLR